MEKQHKNGNKRALGEKIIERKVHDNSSTFNLNQNEKIKLEIKIGN